MDVNDVDPVKAEQFGLPLPEGFARSRVHVLGLSEREIVLTGISTGRELRSEIVRLVSACPSGNLCEIRSISECSCALLGFEERI